MQRSLTRLVTTSAMAAAIAVIGFAATTATASADNHSTDVHATDVDPANSHVTVSPASAEDVWIAWKAYATHEQCRQAGRDMIGVGAVVDYKCEWDSPGWMLYLRMVG